MKSVEKCGCYGGTGCRHAALKRGIVFTIDAMLALAVVITLSLSINVTLDGMQFTALRDMQLERIAFDALASMEKAGLLSNAVQTSSATRIKEFVAKMPKNLCVETTIRKYPTETIALVDKQDCSCESRVLVKKREFLLIGGGVLEKYIAEMKVCYA